MSGTDYTVSPTDPTTPADGNIAKKGAAELRALKQFILDSLISGSISIVGVPLTSRSADYTFILTDANLGTLHPTADTTARTFTIPANAAVPFPVGTVLAFCNQNGAGVISIAITSDVMRLAGAGTTGTRTLAANGTAVAWKITSTEWIIFGTGLT